MSLTKNTTPCTYEDISQKPPEYHPGSLSILYPEEKHVAGGKSSKGPPPTYGALEFLSNRVNRKIITFELKNISEIQASTKNPKLRIVVKTGVILKSTDSQASRPETKAYIFKFQNSKERDKTKKVLGDRWEIAKGAKQVKANSREAQDAALKVAVLRSNPNMQQAYTELVKEKKIMTTKEFFDQAHVKQEVLKHQQKELELGPLNDVIAEVRKRVERQRLSPGENVYLPPHLVANILKVYPTVRLAYEMWVPHKFDEDKFWTMFCQSALVHYDNPDIMRDDQFVSSHRENLEKQKRSMEANHPVNRTVDLVREENPFEEEYAMKEDNAPRREGINELDTLHDINLTSNCIIKSTLKDHVVQENHSEATRSIFMGVSNDTDEDHEHLKIDDKRAYFEQTKGADVNAALNEEQRREILESIFKDLRSSTERLQLREVVLDPEEEWQDIFHVDMNEQVFSDLDRKSQSTSSLHMSQMSSDEASIQRIKAQFLSINQLLRPLWTLLQQPQRVLVGIPATKLNLILQELKKKEDELKKTRKNESSMGGIIQPILDSIEIAFDQAANLGFRLGGDRSPIAQQRSPSAAGANSGTAEMSAAPKVKKSSFKMSFGKK
uniref:BSD domain-containing protein n=1 Tax=Percolomonas cosmopolitus TaxID=63605 RepID=A0A7S1KNN2_9EUKA